MHNASRKTAGAIAVAAVSLSSFAVVLGTPAQAAAPGRIHGSVTIAGAGPAANIFVAALKWDPSLQRWVEEDSARSGVDGTYNIGKLLPGTYVVRFYDPTGSLATEFYVDAAGPAEAVPVVITEGREQLASAELGGAAHLTGKVTGSTGAGIGGAEVTAYVQEGAGWTPLQSVASGPDGSYDLGGLQADTYTLSFHDPATDVTEFWNNRAALADAEPITIRSIGTTDGLNAQLATPAPPAPAPTVTASETQTAVPSATQTAAPVSTSTSKKTITIIKAPRVKGKAVVGSRLRVTSGTINPSAVVRKIQWLANGKVIKKATKRRFKVTSKQRGKKIRARVTISAPGYTKLVLKTRPTAKVKA